MKQTAVEWLVNQYIEKLTITPAMVEQAKAMEKEQHDKTAEEWWKEGAHYMESVGRAKWESFEQYYNKTFKSE